MSLKCISTPLHFSKLPECLIIIKSLWSANCAYVPTSAKFCPGTPVKINVKNEKEMQNFDIYSQS